MQLVKGIVRQPSTFSWFSTSCSRWCRTCFSFCGPCRGCRGTFASSEAKLDMTENDINLLDQSISNLTAEFQAIRKIGKRQQPKRPAPGRRDRGGRRASTTIPEQPLSQLAGGADRS